MQKILIIGDHPLAKYLIQEYKKCECVVNYYPKIKEEISGGIDCEELVLLANIAGMSDIEADNDVIAQLGHIASYICDGRQRIVCHLLLRSNETLQRVQLFGFCEAIRKKLDVYPFTMEDVWSRTIKLDREPITLESEKHVHLVVIGISEMAKMVAIQSALVAHYPNYIRDHSKKTRITIIAKDIELLRKDFIRRYQHLFDNCYYRIVIPTETKPVSTFHKPMYEGEMEDFVDVEWEFVEASIDNQVVREKFQMWATDRKQLLTIVMAHSEGTHNVSEALVLPDHIYQNNIPIYIYTPQSIVFTICPNMIPFGMQNCGYDISLPLVNMAKNVNYIYHCCYEDNIENWTGHIRNVIEIDKEVRENLWEQLSNIKRMSCVYHAMTIVTKMRSIGIEEDDWNDFYDISKQDLDVIAQVEHNRWSVEELLLGWRPCTKDEQMKVEADITLKNEFKKRKIHYDLRAYHDLRPDETGKPVEIYDICLCSCLPLIAKTFVEEKGGDA